MAETNPTTVIAECIEKSKASSDPELISDYIAEALGAGPSVRILHRVIACEAGRLAVHCRRDTIALFRVKAGGLDAERRQRDPTTVYSPSPLKDRRAVVA
jgi:hypothetical protein